MKQKQFWNEKFSIENYLYGKQANEFIALSSLQLLKPNDTILCLDEGEGHQGLASVIRVVVQKSANPS